MRKAAVAALCLTALAWLWWPPPERGEDAQPRAQRERSAALAARPEAPPQHGKVPAASAAPPAQAAAAREPPTAGAIKAAAPVELPLDEPAAPGADDPGPGPYLERYDGRSGRMSPHATPGGGEVTTRVSSTGPAPVLTVWVPTVRIQAGAEVVLSATVADERGAPVDAAVAVAVTRRGAAAFAERAMARAALAYELRFPAPAADDGQSPAAYEYAVRADGLWQGQPFQRVATGAFFVHGGSGRVTRTRVERRGGDLALILGAQLSRAGTYWAYAELWGGPQGDKPIAFARDRFENTPAGERELLLEFGGAILRDAAIDGPYLVRNVRLQQVDAFPPIEAEPLASLPPTPPYRASEFN